MQGAEGLEAPVTAGLCSTDKTPLALESCVERACPPGWGHVSVLGTGVAGAIGCLSGLENVKRWLLLASWPE